MGFINTPEGSKISLINDRGEIIVQKVLVGEGPNRIASTFNCMAFSEEGDIWIQTPYEIVLFDQNLNIKTRARYLSGNKVHIYGRMEVFHYFYLQNAYSGFTFFTIPNGTSRYLDGRDFRNSHLVEIFEREQEKLYEIAPVSDRTLSKNLDKSIGTLYFPVYTLDRKTRKLYLTASIDDEITVYDLITRRLESRIKIAHGEFKALKSVPISLASLSSYKDRINLDARNHKIFFLDGGLMVLDYIREIPSGIYEKKIAEDPTYHHFKDSNYHRIIVFDGSKQLTGDLPLPSNGKIMMSLPGNRLLVQLINPDVEEDFIRYGIYEVVKNK